MHPHGASAVYDVMSGVNGVAHLYGVLYGNVQFTLSQVRDDRFPAQTSSYEGRIGFASRSDRIRCYTHRSIRGGQLMSMVALSRYNYIFTLVTLFLSTLEYSKGQKKKQPSRPIFLRIDTVNVITTSTFILQ